MEITRRNTSDFIDLDITDGDAVWYCTDRYNASGSNRIGGGRLRLRNVQWKGDTILSHSDIDYSLKVSSSPAGPRYWVGNQAGMETDMSNLRILVDGTEVHLEPGDVERSANVVIELQTQGCLDDAANTPFATMSWRYRWLDGVYSFDLGIEYLTTVYRWYEYSSATPSDGKCGDRNPWKCGRVETPREKYDPLGCRGEESSNWIWGPADTTFTMFFKRLAGGHGNEAMATVVSDTAIPQLINDHGDNLVITYHVSNDGTTAVPQGSGDRARHSHEITLA